MRPAPERVGRTAAVLWWLAALAFAGAWVHAVVLWSGLPEQVPFRFSWTGETTGELGRNAVWQSLVTKTLVLALTGAALRRPDVLPPVVSAPQDAAAWHAGDRVVRLFAACLALAMAAAAWRPLLLLEVHRAGTFHPGPWWSLPTAALVLVVLGFLFFLFRASRGASTPRLLP